MTRHRVAVVGIGVALLVPLAGCQSYDEGPTVERAAGLVERRTGAAPTGESPAAPPAWLALGALSAESAVATALAHHPSVRADLATVRQAYAHRVEAGLLPNPVLAAGVGFDASGIGTVTASLTQLLSSIAQRPDRVAAADARLQETILRVGQAALDLASSVEQLHRELVHAQQRVILSHQRGELLERYLKAAQDRFDTGLSDAQAVGQATLALSRWRVEHRSMDSQVQTLKHRLLGLMGVPDADVSWAAVDQQADPALPGEEADAAALARASRLEVQAARWQAVAAEHALALARGQRWGGVELGAEFERDDGEDRVGPTGSVALPIFSQGRATVALAQAQLDEAQARHAAAEQAAATRARLAFSRWRGAGEAVALHERHAVPAAERSLMLAQAAFDAGQADALDVLDQRLELLRAREALLESQRHRDMAALALKEAVGWVAP